MPAILFSPILTSTRPLHLPAFGGRPGANPCRWRTITRRHVYEVFLRGVGQVEGKYEGRILDNLVPALVLNVTILDGASSNASHARILPLPHPGCFPYVSADQGAR